MRIHEGVMNRMKNAWKPGLLVVGMAALMMYASGACHRKVAPGTIDNPAGRAVAAAEATQVAVRASFEPAVELVGTAASDRSVNLSARISAYVADVRVNAGDRVKAGDLLVSLDDREIREEMTVAEAQLKQAETEFKRTRQLFESGAASDQSLTAAQSAFDAARAQMERMRVMLSYAQVTAPMDGVVTERLVEIGDLANPGQVLLAVYDASRMRLEVPVPVRLVDRFPLGRAIAVKLDHPAAVVTGKVAEVVSEIDPHSRTRKVKLLLSAGDTEILPGAFGRVAVADDAHEAVVLPAAAVRRVGQLEMVEIVEGGRAVQRMVRTRAIDRESVEILSGLSGGETVVLAAPGS